MKDKLFSYSMGLYLEDNRCLYIRGSLVPMNYNESGQSVKEMTRDILQNTAKVIAEQHNSTVKQIQMYFHDGSTEVI